MIVTITPNLALDVTYELPELRPGQVHRVREVHRRAGGKGVNVARVLRSLGHEVLVLGLAGGPTGQAVRDDLDAAGLPYDLMPCAGETRRTVTTVADGEATLLREPGPVITPREWAALEASVPDADVVVISGSLPPGVDGEALARLAARLDARGVPVIVDTSGEALRQAAPYAWAVKPNAEELAAVSGTDDPVAGARTLRARAVVVSLGADGLLAVTGDEVHRVAPPQVVTGNPTGAGDAVVAALAAGAAAGAGRTGVGARAAGTGVTGTGAAGADVGSRWSDLLADAAALAAAAVLAPLAGSVDLVAYEGFRTCLSSPQER
jgi:tagatose 6-phosphate kinase